MPPGGSGWWVSHLIPRPLHPYLREPSFHHPGWVLQSRHVQLWLSGWSHHSHSSDRETGAWGIAVCARSREARRVCGSVRKSPGLPPEASTWDQTQSLLNSDAQSLSRAGGAPLSLSRTGSRVGVLGWPCLLRPWPLCHGMAAWHGNQLWADSPGLVLAEQLGEGSRDP